MDRLRRHGVEVLERQLGQAQKILGRGTRPAQAYQGAMMRRTQVEPHRIARQLTRPNPPGNPRLFPVGPEPPWEPRLSPGGGRSDGAHQQASEPRCAA